MLKALRSAFATGKHCDISVRYGTKATLESEGKSVGSDSEAKRSSPNCQTGLVRAHRLVLSVTSPVFEVLLSSPGCKDEISLPFCRNAVRQLLLCAYESTTVVAEMDWEAACDLFAAGHFYQFPKAAQLAVSLLTPLVVTVDRAMHVLRLAKLHAGTEKIYRETEAPPPSCPDANGMCTHYQTLTKNGIEAGMNDSDWLYSRPTVLEYQRGRMNSIRCGTWGDDHPCPAVENLWMCLTCAAIRCQSHADGESHFQRHTNQTGHPIAVRLDSLTANHSESFCFKCVRPIDVSSLLDELLRKIADLDLTAQCGRALALPEQHRFVDQLAEGLAVDCKHPEDLWVDAHVAQITNTEVHVTFDGYFAEPNDAPIGEWIPKNSFRLAPWGTFTMNTMKTGSSKRAKVAPPKQPKKLAPDAKSSSMRVESSPTESKEESSKEIIKVNGKEQEASQQIQKALLETARALAICAETTVMESKRRRREFLERVADATILPQTK
jgi:hypothetical protein